MKTLFSGEKPKYPVKIRNFVETLRAGLALPQTNSATTCPAVGYGSIGGHVISFN
jgi:hypothetical protein